MKKSRWSAEPTARPRRRGWAARHPYVVAALALHALLLAGLYAMGPYKLALDHRAASGDRIEASLEQARRLQMQHHLQRLEEMQRRLSAATGAPAASAPASAGLADVRDQLLLARQLVERMERTEQAERAKELARLLKITPEKALAKVQAEDQARKAAQAAKKPAAPADAATQAARLEERAREVLERQQQRQARQSQGSEVAQQQAGLGVQPGGGGSGHGAGKTAGSGGGGQGAGSSGRGGFGGLGGDSTLAGGGLQAEAGFTDPRNYARQSEMPAVDWRSVRQGRGRTLGAGGTLATRIYLDRWMVAGPFAANGAASLDQVYPPEQGVDLDAVYAGKGNRVLQWEPFESPTYPFVPPDRAENAVYYAWTELRVDRDITVWLDIGADDDSKLWLDDTLVWHSGDAFKLWYQRPFYQLTSELAGYDLVEGRRRVTLTAGRHTLLFKLYNGIDLMFFSVVLTP